jgi:CRISPR-associated Csx2 family protein
MKALTFLGAGRYETVTYVWEERSHTTRLFPEALAWIFEPEKVIVFVTERARTYRPPIGERCPQCQQVLSEPKEEQTYEEQLRGLLGDSVEFVPIPEGRSEQELWEIFDRVASAVDEGDTILLDITHAFRSIPMIVFAVATYLRRTKGVTIAHIIYGAYEARDENNRAPIFDLTPLLELLDWTGGAEALLKRGDAELIVEKMVTAHQTLRRMGTGTPEKLKPLGRKLRALSQALHLSRPREVMRIAHDLLPLLEEARTEFERWAKPFALLARQIRNELEPLAFDQSDTLSRENLEKQLGLVEHYLKKGLVVQAVTLAREWVVSYVLLCRGSGDWLRRSDREEAEQALRAAAARLRGENAEPPAWFGQLPHKEELGRLWNELGNLRNDLAHCAMSAEARSAHAIGQDAQTIPQRLSALLDSAPDVVLPGARVVVDLRALYQDTARLDELPHYIERAKELAGEGNEVVLTGQAPIWMYLAIAHALHGRARRLLYTSPVTGEVCIFDHTT